MGQGRRQLVVGLVRGAILALCCCGFVARGADDAAPPAASGTAAVSAAGGPMPYWQAPAVPQAVIQGGAIPAGWQPQAVPYRGIGPDGRPLTMYVAPTYVFTYQVGPPVLAAPPVNRRPPAAGPTYAAAGSPGWAYEARGATPVPVTLPPATVARYQPAPYQFPADARALTGTPVVPPAAPLPGPPAGLSPPPFITAPPPAQWVPSTAPPPPGLAPPPGFAPQQGFAPQGMAPQQPAVSQAGQGWAAAAPALAAAPLAVAAAATASNQSPPVAPPIAPIVAPITAGPPSVPTVPVSATTAAAPPAGRAANTHLWKVVGVHDGDTVTCIDEANQQQKIRLAEIDAPEVSQDFGKVSRDALADMVFGKTIQVVDDGKDRYGRWIGHLYADGIDVNRQMVATGMAWHYASYSQDTSLAAVQAQAQSQRIGLWSQPNPTPPWDYRKNGKKKSA